MKQMQSIKLFSPQDQNLLFSKEKQNNDREIPHATESLEESDPQKKIAHHLDQITALDAAINAIGMR
jgi:3-methyladenine DNA glycosylase AlkC